jgi:hypothetical protein
MDRVLDAAFPEHDARAQAGTQTKNGGPRPPFFTAP